MYADSSVGRQCFSFINILAVHHLLLVERIARQRDTEQRERPAKQRGSHPRCLHLHS